MGWAEDTFHILPVQRHMLPVIPDRFGALGIISFQFISYCMWIRWEEKIYLQQ